MNADKHCRRSLAADEAALAVEVFRMLADPTRVRLLWSLRGRELAVHELASQLERPQAAVSQHLAKLRMSRLVTTRREGTSVYYRVANEHIEQLVTDAVFHAEHASSDTPAHHQPDIALREMHGEQEPLRSVQP